MGFFQPSGILNRRGFFSPPTAAPAFSPTDIAGLKLWLSADSNVTTSGSNVTQWTDKSVNGYVFTPDYSTPDISLVSSVAGLNNKPAIYFQTGTDNGDVGLFNDDAVFESKSVFLVYILTSVSGFEYSVIYENSGINNYTSYDYGNRVFGGYFNGFFDANTLSELGTPYLRTTITNDGIDPLNFYVNGAFDNYPTGDGFYTRTSCVIGNGDARQAGPSPSINQPFQGYISEIIVYDNVVSNTDRGSVESYLNTKYAIY